MIGGKGLQIESRYWLLSRFCTSYQTRHQVSNNYSYNLKKNRKFTKYIWSHPFLMS